MVATKHKGCLHDKPDFFERRNAPGILIHEEGKDSGVSIVTHTHTHTHERQIHTHSFLPLYPVSDKLTTDHEQNSVINKASTVIEQEVTA